MKSVPIDSLSAEELARLARLRYVSDSDQGIQRQRNGSGFVYVVSTGKRVHDSRKLSRIERLAIPPAWREVWICRFADGHLQSTGRDERDRKQYLYHERWREISDIAKFWRLKRFSLLLPRLRAKVARNIARHGLTRTRVLAGMVSLLDVTSVRLGNEEYVRDNGSYGLATLRNRHVVTKDRHMELRFRAKGGFQRVAVVEDSKLIKFLKECQRLGGSHLFQYVDEEGKTRPADAIDVNAYLRELTNQAFTAKDFRTWKASAQVAGMLYENRSATKVSTRKQVIREALAAAAETLGNTITVCRKYYIHPGLFEAYLDGRFQSYFERFQSRPKEGIRVDEQILARFLKRWKSDG